MEDRLQDDVSQTIESLSHAGIKIWMLTGDKVETAKCIAISAGLKSNQQQIFEIYEETDELVLREKLRQFSNTNNQILLIDGKSLNLALRHQEEMFFKIAAQASAVSHFASRCSSNAAYNPLSLCLPGHASS